MDGKCIHLSIPQKVGASPTRSKRVLCNLRGRFFKKIFITWMIVQLLLTSRIKSLEVSWRRVPVDISTLTSGSYIETSARSIIGCALQAGALHNSKVFCYDGERCVMTLGNVSHIREPATLGWSCMTIQGNER